MIYIATFYSHFGAIRFRKRCEEARWPARIMPVPRDLSSSCGSCVRYEGAKMVPSGEVPEEVEQIVAVEQDGYRSCYRAADS